MDFASAGLLISAVYGVIAALKRAVPKLTGAALQVVVLAAGIGVTYLVALSDYGQTQVIGNVAMNDMNAASLILVGLMVGGASTVLHQTIGSGGAVRNIGQNVDQPTP